MSEREDDLNNPGPGDIDETSRRILEEHGIDVDAAIKRARQAEEAKDRELTRRMPQLDLKHLPLEDLQTSELYLVSKTATNPQYLEEQERRLTLLGLNPEQIRQFKAFDEAAIQKKDPHVVLEAIGNSYYFFADSKMKNVPKPESCLISELVAIVDDANAAYIRDHEWMSDEAFAAVASASGRFTDSPYHEEFKRRFKSIGLSEKQMGLFIRNECLITEREKWGYNPQQLSWEAANFSK